MTPASGPGCSAVVPVVPGAPLLARCPEPAVTVAEGRCACGHVRPGGLCGAHEGDLDGAGCRECLTDPAGPHDCPLTIRAVTP